MVKEQGREGKLELITREDRRVAMGLYSHNLMHAVFDRTRVPEDVINRITSPYEIWNSRDLYGRSTDDPAYVLAPPHTPDKREAYLARIEQLRQNPNLKVKVVSCGN